MIELLESRIAPAGLLSISLGKGNVVIKSIASPSVDGAETITITEPTPGEWLITPAMGTELKLGNDAPTASAISIPAPTGSLSIGMLGGNDLVTLDGIFVPKAVTLDGGNGDNAFVIKGVTVGGNLTIKGGQEKDTLEFSGAGSSIGGNFLAALGNGVATASNAGVPVAVAKNFTVTSGSSDDHIQFNNGSFKIGGAVLFSSGAGADKLGFKDTDDVSIAKGVTLTAVGGLGKAVELMLLTDPGNLSVGGSIKLQAKSGAPSAIIGGDMVDIGGSIVFASGPGSNAFLGLYPATQLHVGQKINVTSKADNSTFNPAFGGGFSALDGPITASVTSFFATSATGANVFVSGPMKVTAPAGKSLNVFMPLDSGVVFAGACTFIGKSAKAGIATFNISGATFLGPVKITGSNGNDSAIVYEAIFKGALTVDLGKGDDNIGIATLTMGSVPTVIAGPVILRGGAGGDTFKIGGMGVTEMVTFYQSVLIDNGGDSFNTLEIGPQVTFAKQPVIKGF